MRRAAFVLLGIGLVSWSLMMACGSDDAPSAKAPDASTTTPGTTPPPGSTGTTPPEALTDGGASDASDGAPASEDLPSNPKRISCGSDACDAGNFSVCCSGADGASCKSFFQCNGQNTLRLGCDEPSDCNSGQRCCLHSNNFAYAACENTDQVCAMRLCKSGADCGDGGTCNHMTCNGFDVHVCGTPEHCE